MKKFALVVIVGATFITCSKKDNNPNAESNVMLEEPAVTVVKDSTAKQAAAPATVDTAKAVKDSVK